MKDEMESKLGEEFAIFAKEAKKLRKILRDTQRCFNDINITGELYSAELSTDEEKEITHLTKKPPCFVILGNSNVAKATVANAILGSPLLPVQWDNSSEQTWRTVRFKHGTKRSVSMVLPGSYELLDIDNLMCDKNGGKWDSVPLCDLQKRKDSSNGDGSTTDIAHETAQLEVCIAKPVLNEGGMVVIAEKFEGKASVKEIYSKSTTDIVPIIVYAMSEDGLSDQEVEDLKVLKELDPSVLMCFIQVSNKLDTQTVTNGYPLPSHKRKHNSSRKTHNPMEGIRETLEKNHITSDYVQRIQDGQRLPNTTQQVNSTSHAIRSYLPCAEHNKRNCPHCGNYTAEGEVPQKVFISDSDSDTRNNDDANHSSMDTSNDDDNAFSSSSQNSQQNSSSMNASSSCNGSLNQSNNSNKLSLFKQLLELGFLSVLPPSNRLSCSDFNTYSYDNMDSELIEDFDCSQMLKLVQFSRQVLKTRLVHATTLLNVIHNRCLQMFILTAFDMARDMQVTPKKLEFAKKKETELYSCLLEISVKKQDEIRRLIGETVEDMKEELFKKAEDYDFIGVELSDSGEVVSSKDLKICTGQIQELVLGNLNSTIATRLLASMDILKDSYTGVLARCLESLERSDTQNGDSVRTSLALREILNSAYQVEITVSAGASIIRILLEKMKQLMHAMTWKNTTRIDGAWKRKVAADMLGTLSEHRLARSICVQIKERLKQSHESFAVALRQLENRHSGRLERTEEQRLKVRKVHAPRVAKLALESVSMRDYIMNGMPDFGREVGRGQYGVVYSCQKWSTYGPCAIKSVVPPDEKHWNDLALEFHYTKNVPEHDRLVALRGSVIDYSYGGGSSPAVLLVMDRLAKDLYAAIKCGLDWISRLQVAIDVVQGIRYLHSQGLVHRDIKLKNVLLDENNRGKLTDLGFCKPEAMMSGSIVGTPIHMAPELFSGKYDGSVDVYAFGILFWYVCAGHVKLPYAFEQCTNKEMLWTSVKRGVRPERLSYFDEECWILMSSCWEGEPSKRPLLGVVEPQLCGILERFRKNPRYNKGPDKRRSKSAKSVEDL